MQTGKFENIEQPYLMDSAPGAITKINGKEYLYFGGTSYYELHKNEDVINCAIDALKKYGINSSSSRNSFGTTKLLIDVEKEAAEFFNCEDAVYLSSGFLTDIAAVHALTNKNMLDVVFIDEISHYSNEYAAILSSKPIYKFSHLNDAHLEEMILSNLQPGQKPLIITDGIFPIYGTIAPLDKYYRIVEKYNGILWVDDAHAIGVLGSGGRGTYEHYGLASERLYFGGTFSKALGGYGGIIPGSREFIDEIKNNQIQNGATPPPSSAAAASLKGLKLFRSKPELKLKLWENAAKMKSGLKKLGIAVEKSTVPIAAWNLNSKSEMKMLQMDLMKKNIVIQYIQYIGAGENGALRIVVFSSHTSEQIEKLLYELKKIL